MTTMNDSDMIQTWSFTTRHRADDFAGEINTRTTERMDFHRMVTEWHTVGVHEGTRLNERGTREIHPTATPERAAAYRRSHGFTRHA